MVPAVGALTVRPPVAGTPSFRRIVQFHPPPNSLFSGGQFDVAPLLWKPRSVKRANGDGEMRLPEASSSNWTKPLAKCVADNFLQLALVSGVVFGLENPTLGCLADTYYLSKLSTFGIFIISGLNWRGDEIGAAAEAWPVGLFGMTSILIHVLRFLYFMIEDDLTGDVILSSFQ